MRPTLLFLCACALGCGGAAGGSSDTTASTRSNQNAPPPRPGLTVREQTERLIALVVEGDADRASRERLRGEIAALPLDDADVIQGRSACLEAWRAEDAGEDAAMSRAACRAVLRVLASRQGITERLDTAGGTDPARTPDGAIDWNLTGNLTDTDPRVDQDDSPYDEYTVDVGAGWTIEVDMTSDEFDTYLWLIGPDGTSLVQDDDGGEGTNSRFVHHAATAGTYTVRANSYDGAGRGAYRLHIRAHP